MDRSTFIGIASSLVVIGGAYVAFDINAANSAAPDSKSLPQSTVNSTSIPDILADGRTKIVCDSEQGIEYFAPVAATRPFGPTVRLDGNGNPVHCPKSPSLG